MVTRPSVPCRAAVCAEFPADLQKRVDGHRQAEDGQVLPGEEQRPGSARRFPVPL